MKKINFEPAIIFLSLIVIILVELIVAVNVRVSHDKMLKNNPELQAVLKCNDNETVDFFTKCVAWELNKEE